MEKLIEKFKNQKSKINKFNEKKIKFCLSTFKYSEEIFNKNDWNLFFIRGSKNPFVYAKNIIKFDLLNCIVENDDYKLEKKYYVKINSFLSIKPQSSIFSNIKYNYNDYFSENDLKNNSIMEFISGKLIKDYFELKYIKKSKEDEKSFFNKKIENDKIYQEKILCSFYFYDNKFLTEEEFFSLDGLIILKTKGISYDYHSDLNSKKIKQFYNEKNLKIKDEINIFSTYNNFYPLIFNSKKDIISIKNYINSFIDKKQKKIISVKNIEINTIEKTINDLRSFYLPYLSNHFDCCGAKLAHDHYNLPKVKSNNNANAYNLDLSIFEEDYIFDLIYLFFLKFSFANIFLYLTKDQLYSLEFYKKVFGKDSYKIIHSYYNVNSGNEINLIEIKTPLKASNFLNLGLNKSENLKLFKNYEDRTFFKNKIYSSLFLDNDLIFEIFQLFENLEEKTKTENLEEKIKIGKSKKTKIVKSKFMQFPVRNFRFS